MGKLAYLPVSRRGPGLGFPRVLILLGKIAPSLRMGSLLLRLGGCTWAQCLGHFLSFGTCDSGSTQLAGVDYTLGLFRGTRSLVSFVAIRSERLAFSRGLFFYVLMHSSFRRRLRKRPPETANHSYQRIRKKTRVCFCAHVRT